MSPFVTTFFIVLVVFAAAINVEAGGRCAPDEVGSECGRPLNCQRTCQRRPLCTAQCVPACVCPSGSVRRSSTDSTCVPIRNC
ncbi:chymotrypsin-elastase inhibitor ixodidin-like [Leptopilina heterotoma]|uniref:chymotrypsin-elastase inhibitor ixodidin-like n=1 Tax=Leptopilina heterotoma TaxID=63436 RepID=UPI001CA804AC|nr:chymotrypsin-elastase inhibitor ixodidin-like [Leptopilina heterotoma]